MMKKMWPRYLYYCGHPGYVGYPWKAGVCKNVILPLWSMTLEIWSWPWKSCACCCVQHLYYIGQFGYADYPLGVGVHGHVISSPWPLALELWPWTWKCAGARWPVPGRAVRSVSYPWDDKSSSSLKNRITGMWNATLIHCWISANHYCSIDYISS